MSSSSLITIGMTAYNAQETIGAAIESASAQDWPDFEILIYDDASTDGTADIVSSFCERDRRIISLFGKENRGVAYSRNQLINHAKGDFLSFFDDDDVSVPHRLSVQHARLICYEQKFASGAPVICHTARWQCYPDGAERYEATMGMDEGRMAPHGDAVALRILTGKGTQDFFGSLATCSQMGRVELYRDFGGFDEWFRRGEDTDFNIRLALAGGHFAGVAEPLVRQMMTMSAEKGLEEELDLNLKLLDKHSVFLDKHTSSLFCKDWLKNKYDFLAGKRRLFLCKMVWLFFRHPVETARRVFRALPNIGFNIRFSRFHDGHTK